MERYKLEELYNSHNDFTTELTDAITTFNAPFLMGKNVSTYSETISFIGCAIYGYFYNDLVAYTGEDLEDITDIFIRRLSYDVAVKLPYWDKKYQQIKQLLTTDDLSLLQTSKMTSSSKDQTDSAGGTLQKTATTPTGVSTGTAEDTIYIQLDKDSDFPESSSSNEIETNGFADKYTNAQQKFANATKVLGERSGEILREGSIDDLLKVLEKLPSSFADEVTRDLQKHFIFDYDGEERGIYDDN